MSILYFIQRSRILKVLDFTAIESKNILKQIFMITKHNKNKPLPKFY